MLQLTKKLLAFENGLWVCQLAFGSREFLLYIKESEKFFDVEESLSLFNEFVGQLGVLESSAQNFARNSEYRDEVEIAGELSLSAIYIDGWMDVRLWFSLGKGSGRMLGVHRIKNDFVSVYCDDL